MILKSYLFSQTSGGGYQQYTTDHSETFLKDLCKNSTTTDQIAIHRSGNLAYYAYAHKNSNSDIYGICVVCGEVCLNLQWLYECFQKAFDALAKKGVLFSYSESGEIIKNVTNFSKETAEVDTLFRTIKEYLDERPSYWEKLPPEDFSIPLSSKIVLSFKEDSKDKITDAIRHYHNIVVTMENSIPTSYARTVERLNNEKTLLSNENNELKEDIVRLDRKKKQYKWIFVLSVLLLTGLGVIIAFNRNINSLHDNVNRYKWSIDSLNNALLSKDSIIDLQRIDIKDIRTELRSKSQDLEEKNAVLKDIKGNRPIIGLNIEVKNRSDDYGDIIYSSKTTYIDTRLTAFSLIEGDVDFYLKFYTPRGLSTSSTPGMSPKGYSYKVKASLSLNKTSTLNLSGWGGDSKGHWKRGSYRIEVWYNNYCVQFKDFTIY